MVLPSQHARPIDRRSYMYRRSRKRRRPITLLFAVGAVAIVALGVWMFWPDGENSASVDGDGSPEMLAGPAELDTSSAELALNQSSPNRQDERSSRTGSPTGTPERTITQQPEPRPQRPAQQPEPGGIEMGGSTTPSTPASTRTTNPPASRQAEREPEPQPRDERATEPDPAPQQPPATSSPPAASGQSPAQQRAFARAQAGLDLIARNEPLEARRMLSEVLATELLDSRNDTVVRQQLAELNARLVFSPEIVPGDPFAMEYKVQRNDALSKIPRKMGLQIEWQLLKRINRISDPKKLRLDQRLKLITGPFHAVIHKRLYRMDLYLGEGDERVFVRSLPVGLGEFNSTPEGRFRVRPKSKLINPAWANPRTGERFSAKDPKNPIGDFWIGLIGDEEHLQDVNGYGIHGTIEPESIGRQASMGCVRMLPADIALVYELLLNPESTIHIRP